jgi:hypothetical protein
MRSKREKQVGSGQGRANNSEKRRYLRTWLQVLVRLEAVKSQAAVYGRTRDGVRRGTPRRRRRSGYDGEESACALPAAGRTGRCRAQGGSQKGERGMAKGEVKGEGRRAKGRLHI